MIGYHHYKGNQAIVRSEQCSARLSLTRPSSSRRHRSHFSYKRTLLNITNAHRAAAATKAMLKPITPTRLVSLRASLPRPRSVEVNTQRLQAINPKLGDMHPEFLRRSLSDQAPLTLAGLHSARLPVPTAPLPHFLEVPITDAISVPAVCPSHVLGFVTRTPAGKPNLTMFPIHELIFAANCSSFPALPLSTSATSEGNREPTVTMPLVLLNIPSPATFPSLQTYLYTKNPPAMQAELLPQGWQKDVTSILQRSAMVEGMWKNGHAFGIVDQVFWDIIEDSWSQILNALHQTTSSPSSRRSYTNFTGKVQFVATGENQCEATWTGNYDPVGDAGPPEHIKNVSSLTFKTFEKAVLAKKTVTHSETLDASPDAVWKAWLEENTILPKALPHIFESCTFVEGNGEVGSIRVCKMGPAIPDGGELVERLHLVDEATKKMGYTVIKGDPRFKHVSAVVQYAPGPTEGTTTATWTATYVPITEGVTMDPKFIVAVWKALEGAAKA